MKRSDRMILAGLATVGLLAALWFLVIAPKREQASELGDQVAELQATVSEQEALADQAEAAEADFPRSYSAMVRLGKAVPSDSDTASLVDQLDTVSRRADSSFLSLVLAADEGAAAAPVAAPAPPEPADAATDATPTNLSAGEVVPATEASVAQAPLGAGVGPAGLLTMPYDLKFLGEFEGLADFFAQLDAMVHVDPDGQLVTRGSEAAKGRLLTVNGFSIEVPENGGGLEANMRVTSYVTPHTQGLTAGATEAGPPAEVPAAAPADTSTASTPAPTAAVAP